MTSQLVMYHLYALYEKYAQSTVTRNSFRDNDAHLVAEQILEIVREEEA